MKVSRNCNCNWNNDAIQFPRLIAELEADGAFTPEVIGGVAAQMDCTVDEVFQLIDRAQKKWDRIKALTLAGKPV
jgi:hypothetical protein